MICVTRGSQLDLGGGRGKKRRGGIIISEKPKNPMLHGMLTAFSSAPFPPVRLGPDVGGP